jgi:uncharacterized protein YdaU (DUF1376 family)
LKNAPAFQFYARDWLADAEVRLLTLEQRGAYIDLLAYCWERDGLPTDAEKLRKLIGATSKEAARVLPAVLPFFTESDGLYRNGKLDKVREKSDNHSAKQSARAKSRWDKEKNATALPTRMPACNALIADADANAVEDSNTSPARGRDLAFPKPANDLLGERCPSFVAFYSAYPKKSGRRDAYAAWHKLHPSAELQETINQHVDAMKGTWDWRKEDGQYVPSPAAYINKARWTDEIPQRGKSSNGNGRHGHPEPEDTMRYVDPETGDFES